MPVNIILMASIAFVVVYSLAYVMWPINYNFAYNNPTAWQNVSGDALNARDRQYQIGLYWPLLLSGAIIVWAYRMAGRKSVLGGD